MGLFITSKSGIELERVDGDTGDPPEGSNVTFICSSMFAEVKFPSPPEWAYQISNIGRMHIINELNPPKGLFYPIIIFAMFIMAFL